MSEGEARGEKGKGEGEEWLGDPIVTNETKP